MKKTIVAMTAALAVTVAYAGDSAPFPLNTFDGTRTAQDVESIAYSTAWDNGTSVRVAVDGVTLKEAVAPASGDMAWSAANAGKGLHTLTHTTYKNGVASKVETAIFQVVTPDPVTPDPEPVITQQVWTVTFNAQGGVIAESLRVVTNDCAVGELPAATWDGHTLDGWFTAASGGAQVSASTKVTANVTYYAHWTETGGGGSGGTPGPTPTPPVEPEEAFELHEVTFGSMPVVVSTYDGYLYDANGNVKGTIQVKAGKPNANTKLASVKAVVVGLDGKKKNLKAAEKGKALIAADGPTTVTFVSGEACEVTLGAKGMTGKYGNYTIDGALNMFTSKDAADKAVVSEVLGQWRGAVNVVWRLAGDGSPYQTLTVSIAAKGKAKVSGMLADGTKVSAASQLIVGEEWCCVPVAYAKKGVNLAFNVWVPKTAARAALPTVVGLANAVVGKPGTLKGGGTFCLDAVLGDAKYADYLPDGMAVTQSGTKWTLPKAGKVQLAKDGTVDEAKLGENPSALKLTYKAADGTFKGTFKAYADVNGKPKATTVNVTGVLVNGVGYGAATIKKSAVSPVTIE